MSAAQGGSAASVGGGGNSNAADALAGARLSRQLPSDLKPLLSMNSTLSIEHPSASGDGSNGGDSLRRWFERNRRSADDEVSAPSAPSSSSSSVFSLGPCLSELKACFLLAWPLVCQNILYLSNGLVLIVVVGHSAGKKEEGGTGGGGGGEKQLAAAVLGTSLFNVTGLSIAIGLSTALETLCAQAYGARAYLLLGGLLQRALAVQAAAFSLVGAFWFFGLDAALVHFFGQERELALAASRFVRQCSPGLLFTAASECVRRYLVAQGVVGAPAVAAAASAAVSAATAVALVPLWGLAGAAAAVNLSSAASLAALAGGAAWNNARNRRYSAFEAAAAVDDESEDGIETSRRRRRRDNDDDAEETGGGGGGSSSEGGGGGGSSSGNGSNSSNNSGYHVTWGGWSLSNAFSGWGPYIRVAAPSAAQVCIEWWTFEAIVLMSGLILPDPAPAVAATGIGFQTVTIAYSLALGMAAASATRVGNELGAGNPLAAARAALVSTLATLFLSSSAASAVFGARAAWARLFTSDEAVLEAAALVLPWTAAAIVGDGVNGALGGCVRGAGRQESAALLNVFFYWALGIPASALLAFKFNQGVRGLWIGLAATTVVQCCAMATLVFRFDWRGEAAAAKARVEKSGRAEEERRRGSSEAGGGGGGGDGGLIRTVVVVSQDSDGIGGGSPAPLEREGGAGVGVLPSATSLSSSPVSLGGCSSSAAPSPVPPRPPPAVAGSSSQQLPHSPFGK